MMDRTCSFECVWFDDVQAATHSLTMRYYPDKSIEIKEEECFLKRTVFPTIKYEDLCVGNRITVFGKNLQVCSIMDARTRNILEARMFRVIVMYQHSLEGSAGILQLTALLNTANELGLKIQRLGSGNLDHCSGSCISFTSTSVQSYQAVLSALQAIPHISILSADFGDDISQIFKRLTNNWRQTSPDSYCTCCVIKPHIFQGGTREVSRILEDISSRNLSVELFQLSTINFSTPVAKEMFGCYRGVIDSYSPWLDEYCVGPSLCLGLRSRNEAIVAAFREECGPINPTVAKIIRPLSIRALFGGKSVAKNAVHCTDLPEDGEMECDYIFNGLSGPYYT